MGTRGLGAVAITASLGGFAPAAVAIVGTLCFFFVFQRVAYLSLPLGIGPFRELSTFLMAVMGVR